MILGTYINKHCSKFIFLGHRRSSTMQPAPVISFLFTTSQCRSFSLDRSDTSLFPEQDTLMFLSNYQLPLVSIYPKTRQPLGFYSPRNFTKPSLTIPAQINCSFIMHEHLTPLDIGSYAALHHQELSWYVYTLLNKSKFLW